MTLAYEDPKSKLVEVVSVADVHFEVDAWSKF